MVSIPCRMIEKPQLNVYSCSAAAAKAGPLNADELCKLLLPFEDHYTTHDTSMLSHNMRIRSPSLTPAPTQAEETEAEEQHEAFCHHELINAGGRPAASLQDLFRNRVAYRKRAVPWLGDESPTQDGDIPPLLYGQWKDWQFFRHSWQWYNRGLSNSEKGFNLFLEFRKRKLRHHGESQLAARPDFEESTRFVWEFQPILLEQSKGESFLAYAQAVKIRLLSHNFTRSFQLAEDPRVQDSRTTWIEYLSYVYWRQDKHAEKMRMRAAETETYQKAEKAFRRRQLQAQWVYQELHLMEEAMAPLEHETSKDSRAGNSKKRRRTNNDLLPRPRPKKILKVNGDSIIPDLESESQEESAARRSQRLRDSKALLKSEPGEGLALRRSQRLRARKVVPEAHLSKPQGIQKDPRKARLSDFYDRKQKPR